MSRLPRIFGIEGRYASDSITKGSENVGRADDVMAIYVVLL